MICINKRCGKEIPNESKFCMYCGKNQKEKARTKRANGEGSIYQMPDKRWKAEIVLGYEIDGYSGKLRKVRRTKIADTKSELVELMPDWRKQCIEEYKALIKALEPTPQPEPEQPENTTPTLSDCWKIYCDSRAYDGLSKSQKQKLGYAWNKCEALHDKPITEITLDDMQEIVDTKAPTYYPAKDIRTVLSHCMNVAIKRDLINFNRTEYLELPSLKASERQPFTNDDIETFWNAWEKDGGFVGYILVMIYAGLRPGELRGLQIENINLKEQYMTGGIKTDAGRNRTIPIADRIVPVLAKLISERTAGKLVTMSEDRFYASYWDTIERLQVTRLQPYSCRHTYFTRLAEADVQPGVITAAGGHESYSTTMTYTHVRLEKLLDEVNKIDPKNGKSQSN